MWIADATSALLIYILECNPATADTLRRQIFIRVNHNIKSLNVAKEMLKLIKKYLSSIFFFFFLCTVLRHSRAKFPCVPR